MTRAQRICATPGCPERTTSGYCPACEAKRPKRVDLRPSSTKRGYGPRWQQYSRDYRARNPWCRQCTREGRRSASQAVDHIQPVTGPNDPRFWDPSNHQPLCRSCHAVKTQAEGKTAIEQPAPVASPSRWRFA